MRMKKKFILRRFRNRYRTSEIYDPDLDDFTPGPELPYDSKFSCTVEVPGQPGLCQRKRDNKMKCCTLFFTCGGSRQVK